MVEQIFAAIGLTCILKYGSILDFVRKPLTRIAWFEGLFNCSLCLGFWAGVAVAGYAYWETQQLQPLLPFVTAAACWLFDSVIGVLQVIEMKLDTAPEESEEPDD